MFIDNLCPPALIYLIFSLVQIIIDTLKGLYNTAFVKVWITILFTSLLNILCERGLSVISWLIVFLTCIFLATLTTILLISFGMDPYSGKIFKTNSTTENDMNNQDKQYILNNDGLTHGHLHVHADGTQHSHIHTHPNYLESDHSDNH